MTISMGNSDDMQKTIDILDEVQATIRNAYKIKTGMDDKALDKLINAETYMNAYKAVELGFCDKVMFEGDISKVENKGTLLNIEKPNYINQIVAKISASDSGFLTSKGGNAEETSALHNKILNIKKEMVLL